MGCCQVNINQNWFAKNVGFIKKDKIKANSMADDEIRDLSGRLDYKFGFDDYKSSMMFALITIGITMIESFINSDDNSKKTS